MTVTTATATDNLTRYRRPEGCPPWCTAGHDDPEGDRIHFSGYEGVRLSLAGDSEDPWKSEILACLHRSTGNKTRVAILWDDQWIDMSMTEAVKTAKMLLGQALTAAAARVGLVRRR